jgi:hypothetical protein
LHVELVNRLAAKYGKIIDFAAKPLIEHMNTLINYIKNTKRIHKEHNSILCLIFLNLCLIAIFINKLYLRIVIQEKYKNS